MSAILTAPAPLPPAALTPPCAVIIDERLRVPAGIDSLAAFRSWAHSDEFPEFGRIAYLNGTLWIDLTMEQLYSHNQVKAELGIVLGGIVKALDLGLYMPDGMQLSHPGANLSTVPDVFYASYATLQAGLLQEVPGRHGGWVEFEGTPDMVLEVVSDSSVEKDNVLLPPLYLAAGIPEFWRIDVRGEPRFEILQRTPAGYVPTQLPDGWWRSLVFHRDFRLIPGVNVLGRPRFNLEVRP
jgi:Uma2 family endonuclease